MAPVFVGHAAIFVFVGAHPVGDGRVTRPESHRNHGGVARWELRGVCEMPQRLVASAGAGLRVVDALVMPRIMSGNTHAPTNMFVDKAADWIRVAH